jgi:hypothetical protein
LIRFFTYNPEILVLELGIQYSNFFIFSTNKAVRIWNVYICATPDIKLRYQVYIQGTVSWTDILSQRKWPVNLTTIWLKGFLLDFVYNWV